MIILTVVLIFILIGLATFIANKYPLLSILLGMLIGSLTSLVLFTEVRSKTYYKSSDMAYWELSDKQFKRDTITIDTVYYEDATTHKRDTAYMTRHYIVVE